MSFYESMKAYVKTLDGRSIEMRSVWRCLHDGSYTGSLTEKEWLSLRRMAQRRILGTVGKK